MTSTICHRFLLIAVALMPGLSLADWLVATSQLAARPSPTEQEVMAQNPPSFRWPRHPSLPEKYELELIAPDGTKQLAVINRNWYLPDHLLAYGNWTWRVRPLGSADWSQYRRFTLGRNARSFIVPNTPALKKQTANRPRPRSISVSLSDIDNLRVQISKNRPEALQRLIEDVNKNRGLPSVSDSDFPMDISGKIDWGKLSQIRQAYKRITQIGQQAEESAFLYLLTKDKTYLQEATRRGAELAALDPKGVTAHSKDDQTSRRIALSLAQVTDQIGEYLPPKNRADWWNAVGQRAHAIYVDLAKDGGQLEQFPYHSHGGVNLGYLAALACLSLGELPESEQWFDYATRHYFDHVWPWAGPEGGYSNGTAYAQYAVHDALRVWPILHYATGVNLFAKPWSEGLVDFFAWFAPPGTPTHMFGSDAESKPVPWLLKAFASRIRTPVAKWYVRNLIGEQDALIQLQAPFPLPVDEVPTAAPPSNAAWIRSIGWVAMHSNMADRGRTSIYFKSSQFGSYGHSHADQNSFVINSAGRTLLTDSGVYDWYGSAHFTGWYRRTEAHNAITFDGGQGQFSRDSAEGSFAATGKILSARLSPPVYRADGDATPAYMGALTKASRTLWYVPERDWVIIRDRLASAQPRSFEFNLHALVPFVESGQGYRITNEGVSACIDILTPQQVTKGAIRAGYPVPPDGPKPPAAYSLRLATKQPVASTEIWTAIRVGCAGNPLAISQAAGNHTQIANEQAAIELE